MAHQSFVLNSVPNKTSATTFNLDATFYTSRGNSLAVKRQITVASYTFANVYAAIKAIASNIEAAEVTAIADAAAALATPDPLIQYVGKRYDATTGPLTVLADVDTPIDTGAPAIGGG